MKLAIALFAGASILGCAVQDQTVTEINAAEWLERGREFAYIHHTFTGRNYGIVRPTSVYSASGIDVYRRTVEADGAWDPVELAEADSLIGRELATSRNRSAEKGLAIDSVYESLCIGDHCITQ